MEVVNLRSEPPSRVASAAAGVAVLTLILALAGVLGLRLDPLLAQGALMVALGGTILGTTISAVGLLVTRHGRDATGRRRAWIGAALSITLLVALVVAFQMELGGPIVVPEAEATSAQVSRD